MFKKVKIDTPEVLLTNGESSTPMITTDEEVSFPKRGVTGVAVLDTNKPTVISEGFSLKGDIVSDGILHIEGRTSGTIKASSVNVGPRGQVEGNVSCASLHIKGVFTGTAVCGELVIAASAVVKGHITYQQLTIGRGATVEGDLIVRR
jgi:cytoskeletal protein CcmA (bactofilin family)